MPFIEVLKIAEELGLSTALANLHRRPEIAAWTQLYRVEGSVSYGLRVVFPVQVTGFRRGFCSVDLLCRGWLAEKGSWYSGVSRKDGCPRNGPSTKVGCYVWESA